MRLFEGFQHEAQASTQILLPGAMNNDSMAFHCIYPYFETERQKSKMSEGKGPIGRLFAVTRNCASNNTLGQGRLKEKVGHVFAHNLKLLYMKNIERKKGQTIIYALYEDIEVDLR